MKQKKVLILGSLALTIASLAQIQLFEFCHGWGIIIQSIL